MSATPETPSARLPEPGTVLAGRYRVEALLGRGGMGAVYLATNVVTDKRVAIKWLLHGADDHTARERFVREARAAARIPHPNVVDVYDVVEDAGSMFLVMEYLVGEPFSALLARGELAIPRLLGLLLPAMRAVAVAHARGVIHRDLKPENLFLCRGADGAEHLKVLDFGISKLLASNAEHEESLTRSGSAVGTPRYMPVEQLSGDKDVDGRVDVYAFGVILYQALTGQLPFEGDSYGAIAIRVATHAPPLPRKLRPDIPPALERAVLGAMARNRAARFSSMDELVKALEGVLQPQHDLDQTLPSARALPSHVASTPPQTLPAREVPAARSPRRTLWWAAGIVLSGFAIWALLRGAPPASSAGAEHSPEKSQLPVSGELKAVSPPAASALPGEPTVEPPAMRTGDVVDTPPSAARPQEGLVKETSRRAPRARLRTPAAARSRVPAPSSTAAPVAAPAAEPTPVREQAPSPRRAKEPASVQHRAGELEKAQF